MNDDYEHWLDSLKVGDDIVMDVFDLVYV